jgi:hypothetical protein
LENFVVVDAHKAKPEGKMPRREIQVLFALGEGGRQIELLGETPVIPSEAK